MYYIVCISGFVHEIICKDNKPNKYGDPKLFKNKKECEKWIEKHSYKGMSFRYEIRKEVST